MRRPLSAFLAAGLLLGLLSLPTSAGAAAYCSGDEALSVEAIPSQIDLENCDVVGRTVADDTLRTIVPPPGHAESVIALSADGTEHRLLVSTSPDGVVSIDSQALESHADEAAHEDPPLANPFVATGMDGINPGSDNFADAPVLQIPAEFLPSRGQTFLSTPAQTREAGEPDDCDSSAPGTVWYRIGRLGSLQRIKLKSDVAAAIFTGTSLSDLTLVQCMTPWAADELVLLKRTTPYYVQVPISPEKSAAHLTLSNAENDPFAPPPCDSRKHAFLPDTTARKKLSYRVNPGRHYATTVSQTIRAVKQGINVITGSKNDCGMPDRVSAKAEYLGRTRKLAQCFGGSDGKNVVAWGPLSGGPIGLACSKFTINSGGDLVAYESDILLGDHVVWTHDPDRSGCLVESDIVGVVAHEAGHVFGLDHALGLAGNNQTMATHGSACRGAQRTLGRGDVIALRKRY